MLSPLHRRLVIDKYLATALVVVTTQQLVVACSTLCLAWLVRRVAADGPTTLPLGLLLLTLTLPYVFSIYGKRYLIRSIVQSYMRYLHEYEKAITDKPTIWTDERISQERSAFIVKEAPGITSEAREYAYDFTSTFLNVILNVIALCVAVERILAISFGSSLIIAFVVTRIRVAALRKTATDAQAARVSFDGVVMQSWNALVPGNHRAKSYWQALIQAKIKNLSHAEDKAILTQEVTVTAAVLGAIMPIAITILTLSWIHAGDFVYLAVFFSSLPRQFILISHLYVVYHYVSRWNVISARLAGLSDILARIPDKETVGRIKLPSIQVTFPGGNKHCFLTVDELLKELPDRGRVTIEGPNGVGKSTLLFNLKRHFKEKSILLRYELLDFYGGDEYKASTGEKWVAALSTDVLDPVTQVLLLDEWSANLDSKNRSHMSNQLDACAGRFLVVEVLHKRDSVSDLVEQS